MMVLPFDECGVGLAVFGSISSNLAITSIGRRSFFLSSFFFCLFSVLTERVVFKRILSEYNLKARRQTQQYGPLNSHSNSILDFLMNCVPEKIYVH